LLYNGGASKINTKTPEYAAARNRSYNAVATAASNKRCPNLQKILERQKTDIQLTGGLDSLNQAAKLKNASMHQVGPMLQSMKQKNFAMINSHTIEHKDDMIGMGRVNIASGLESGASGMSKRGKDAKGSFPWETRKESMS